MNTKIKLLITLAIGMYFFTGCDNGSTTTTDKDTDTTKMNNMENDTMNNKMSTDDMKTNDSLKNVMNISMVKMEDIKMTGDFDHDFANMMIEHHQGAIDMSKIEVAKGAEEKIKVMAQNIIVKQTEEIRKLQEIIKNFEPSEMHMGWHNELNKEMKVMKAKMSGIPMTGNVDKDFAMMMISHHESAVKMSKDELSHGMDGELKQMAKKGISEQTKEINEFKTWMFNK